MSKDKALTIIRIILLWIVGTIALGSLMLLSLPSEIEVIHTLKCKQDADFLRREFVFLENWRNWRSEWIALDSSACRIEGTDGLAGFVVQNGAFHWRLLGVSNENVIDYRRRHPAITGHVIKGRVQLKQDGDSTQLVWTEKVKLEWQQRWKVFGIKGLLETQVKTDASDLLAFTQNSVKDCPGYAVLENYHSINYVVLRHADSSNFTTACKLKLKEWCLRNGYEPFDKTQWLIWPFANLQSDSMVAPVMVLEADSMNDKESSDTLVMDDDFMVMYFNDEVHIYSRDLSANVHLNSPELKAKLKDVGKKLSFPMILEALEGDGGTFTAKNWLRLYRIKLIEQKTEAE